jgi:hypothetical protein
MNEDYPCLIVKRHGKEDEYCDLYRAASILGRPMKGIFEALEAYGGVWRTMAFEVLVESENSRVRRIFKQRSQ